MSINKLIPKYIFSLLIVLSFLFSPSLVGAQSDQSEVIIFTSPTCPHCNAAKDFFNDLSVTNDYDFKLVDYTLANEIALAKQYYEDYQVPASYQGLVPIMFIGDRYFVGFNDQIALDIQTHLNVIEGVDAMPKSDNHNQKEKIIKLPFLGEVDLYNFSLPILAIIMGTIDGFNVCSLGALVLILGLVIALRSRRRILLLGSTFLLTTGLVYGLMIFLWHQIFSVLAPYVRSLELVVGLLSVFGGIYLLREFYQAWKRGPICSSNNILSRLMPKVEQIFQNKTNWFLLMATVILFSGAVTIIEFPCSAVLPVLFTGILVESGVSQSTAIAYITLFLLFYLLDELIVFLIAVFTMKIKIVSPRFIIFFNLLAALIFLALGAFYLLGLSL